MSKRESINQEPLTIEELKTMAGLPVWCPEEEAYGIVMCDKIGQWAGIPFLHGVWYSDDDGVGVEFNHNIIGRKLKCFRVEDKKEIVMPLQNKGSNHRDRRSDHADLVDICRIRRKKEWRTIKFMITQTHTWKAT